MNILISNDDGVYALGIMALAQAVSKIANVYVVAPDRDRSAVSQSLTVRTPLRPQQIEENIWKIDGTPSDCVHLGLTGLLDVPIDMVISGINIGANLGDDVLYSGTVAAAIEGRFLGRPSIAFSYDSFEPQYMEEAAEFAAELVTKITRSDLPASTILNVNFPNCPRQAYQGVKTTRLGRRHPSSPCIEQTDPRGRPIYWLGLASGADDAEEGTDFHAIEHGFVSITPINLDLTHYQQIPRLSELFDAS